MMGRIPAPAAWSRQGRRLTARTSGRATMCICTTEAMFLWIWRSRQASLAFRCPGITIIADRRLAEGKYIPMTIRLSEEAYEQYAAWLFSEENSYIYSDLYGIDDALAEAEKYKAAIEAQASQHTDFITDIAAIPDTEEIKSRILDNNEEFLREHPEYMRLEDAWIDMISDVLVSAVEKYRLL